MNREIKFRVWNGSDMEYDIMAGKFGVFYVNPGDNKDGLNSKDTACLNPFNTIYSKEIRIMQFTGLKDKNGVGIYEGDILSNNIIKGEVIYLNGQWYMYDEFFLHEELRNNKDPDTLYDFKIIGNIYDNSELLK